MSVGLIPRRLPFTTSNTIVRTFRHAVSLDERRAKFKANLWNRPDARERQLGVSKLGLEARIDVPGDGRVDEDVNTRQGDRSTSREEVVTPKHKVNHHLTMMERQYSEEHDAPTDIEEVGSPSRFHHPGFLY